MSFPCYPLETFETWEIEENLEPAEDKHLVTLNNCFCFVQSSFIVFFPSTYFVSFLISQAVWGLFEKSIEMFLMPTVACLGFLGESIFFLRFNSTLGSFVVNVSENPKDNVLS